MKKLSINQANDFYLEIELDRILNQEDIIVDEIIKEVKDVISHFTMIQHYNETLH